MIIALLDHKKFLVSGLWFLVSVLGRGERMATLKRFEDIEAWKKGARAVSRCLSVLKGWSFRPGFWLTRSDTPSRGFSDV